MILKNTITKKERLLWIYKYINYIIIRPVEGCQGKITWYGIYTRSYRDMNNIPHHR
jgi:hypothetical protein